MKRERISAIYADAASFTGREITVCGWARTIRDMKNFGFVALNDGSSHGNLQVVLERAALANYDEIARQNVGAALIVRGELVLTPEAKQPFELKASSVEVEGPSTPDYPLQKKRHSIEFLRTIQHLRPRTNLFNAVFRVRSVAAAAIHEFFQQRGFVYVHTPIITASDCEGAGEMFEVTTLDPANPPRNEDGSVDYSQDFFGKRANLTVSGQLNAENFAMAFGDVYTFGPTFRAEKSNTQRHAAEFWMIEPEMAFADLTDYMDNAEAMIKYVIRRVMERCPQEMDFFTSFVDKGLTRDLVCRGQRLRPRHLHRGHKAARGAQRQVRLQGLLGLRPPDRARALPHRGDFQEAALRHGLSEGDKGLLYAHERGRQNRRRRGLLVPGIGELIGGSQREERLDVLEARMDRDWASTARTTGGISTSAATAPAATPATASASSALSCTSPA